jgi:hypothetical protein
MGTHPQIGVSTPKEVDFFSYYFDRGAAWYGRHFDPKPGQSQQFESSPSYFHDPRSPERVFAYNPQMKIIALLRDPVARAASNHLHEVIKGHIGPIPFAEGLKNNPAYVEQGMYHRHLSRWFAVFPRDQILVLLAEEISADPQAAIRAIYDFAGVDPAFRSPIHGERRNESDRARSPALRRGLRAGGDFLRARGLEGALARLKKTGPVARVLSANSVDLRAEVPAMTAADRAGLEAVFAPEMAALPPLIGRDTLPWPTWEAAR